MTRWGNLAVEKLEDVQRKTADERHEGDLPEKGPRLDKLLIKVGRGEDKGEEVRREANQLGDNHQPVPGAHGKREHEKLRENDGRKGDGHHVDKLVVKEQNAAVHNHRALVDGDEDPNEEGLVGQGTALHQLVQLRKLEHEPRCDVLVEDNAKDGKHRVEGGIADHEEALIERN